MQRGEVISDAKIASVENSLTALEAKLANIKQRRETVEAKHQARKGSDPNRIGTLEFRQLKQLERQEAAIQQRIVELSKQGKDAPRGRADTVQVSSPEIIAPMEQHKKAIESRIEGIESTTREHENENSQSGKIASLNNSTNDIYEKRKVADNLREKMNSNQRTAVIVGLGLVLLMLLVPPWIYDWHYPAGYHFLFKPPNSPSRIDIIRLTVQCIFVVLLTGGIVFILQDRKK